MRSVIIVSRSVFCWHRNRCSFAPSRSSRSSFSNFSTPPPHPRDLCGTERTLRALPDLIRSRNWDVSNLNLSKQLRELGHVAQMNFYPSLR